MVFHVYLNWTGDQYKGREILVFANRQFADEFYNRCIETNDAKTQNPLTDIVRHTPQFWSFHVDESRPFWFVESNAKDLMPTYMAARINGYDNNFCNGSMPVILNDPTGNADYKSGHSYYIRTKATPHLYWFYEGSGWGIHLSASKRSKFQLDREVATDAVASDPRRVLERKDIIRVTALSSKHSHEVGVQLHHIAASDSPWQFSFGSFYNGDLGVDWQSVENTAYALISYKVPYAGEEWELVS